MHIKQRLKRLLPKPDKIVENKSLKMFGKLLYDPNIWHLTRHSIARATAVGLFFSWVPLPIQMALAAGAAIIFKANIAVSVALVWISNPVTMPFLFYFAYVFGTFILQIEKQPFAFELSLSWIISTLQTVGGPFLLGCTVLGILSAAIGYFACHFLWRRSVKKSWYLRSEKRKTKIFKKK